MWEKYISPYILLERLNFTFLKKDVNTPVRIREGLGTGLSNSR
jgi:hypothetical protein